MKILGLWLKFTPNYPTLTKKCHIIAYSWLQVKPQRPRTLKHVQKSMAPTILFIDLNKAKGPGSQRLNFRGGPPEEGVLAISWRNLNSHNRYDVMSEK